MSDTENNTESSTGINLIKFDTFTDGTNGNTNRRRLTIISQTPTEMIVDIDRYGNIPNGTPLSASEINERLSDIAEELKSFATKGTLVRVYNAESDDYIATDVNFDSDPQEQIKKLNEDLNKEIEDLSKLISANTTNITKLNANTTLIRNTAGGFSAGENATSTTGGAVGMNSKATSGFAGGYEANSDWGGVLGVRASALLGGAIGTEANATSGFAGGASAIETAGGAAIGNNASATTGFAGGKNAKSNASGAIQLGEGTNNIANSLQIANDNIYNADSHTLNVSNINSENGLFLNNNALSIVDFDNSLFGTCILAVEGTNYGSMTGYFQGLVFEDTATKVKTYFGNVYFTRGYSSSDTRFNDVARCVITYPSTWQIYNGGILYHTETYDDNNEVGTLYCFNKSVSNVKEYRSVDYSKDWALNETSEIVVNNIMFRI